MWLSMIVVALFGLFTINVPVLSRISQFIFFLYVSCLLIPVAFFSKTAALPVIITMSVLCAVIGFLCTDEIIFGIPNALINMGFALYMLYLTHTNPEITQQIKQSVPFINTIVQIAMIYITVVGGIIYFTLYYRKILRELERTANYDSLTGVYNRRCMFSVIDYLIEKEECFYLIIADLDNFKNINDLYGHQTGDDFIRKVADHFCECAGEHGEVARYGGDEFFLVIDSDMDIQKIVSCMTDFDCIVGGEIISSVTISGGVAEYEPGDTRDDLFKKADMKLLKAKTNGKNIIVV
jgi:diguanylate cyclase (GGDEF)-like protein